MTVDGRTKSTGALKLNPRELAMAEEARSRLGRGLASLIGDVGGEAAHLDRPRAQRKVPIEFLKPNPRNPRRDFSDTELGELADSIKQHGVIQPIVVRPLSGVPDPIAVAKRIVEQDLNVRQAEALAHVEGVPARKPQKARGGKAKDPNTVALEKRVSDALGLAVSIDHRDPGGTVHIRYRELEQLDDIVRRLDKGN